MPRPEPFSDLERDYYEALKELIRQKLPTGQQVLGQLHEAYEAAFAAEGLALSRKDRFRLFLLIMAEITAEIAEAESKLLP